MLTMIIQIAVAFVATVSFAVLFQVPKEQYVYSGSVELPVGGATFWLWQVTLPQQFPLLPQLWC